MEKAKPFSILVIEETIANELYAEVRSSNGKTIWKISESYKDRKTLVNALRYIPKPDVIKIDLESRNWKYVKKLEMMIDELWMNEKTNLNTLETK